MTGHMRLEQRMKLAPHMIQSMEILQLPIMALQERIEQELNNNPVLELEEPTTGEDQETVTRAAEDDEIEQRDLVVNTDTNKADDFERLSTMDRGYTDFIDQSGPVRPRVSDDEPDSKLQALKNAAAAPQSLHEHLTEQWRLIDAEPAVKEAGGMIIDYIDNRGYLSVRLEQLHNKDKHNFTVEDLFAALELVQQLEPTGVGARDIKECLLIQLSQGPEDTTFERTLVADHMQALLENRLPDIARKMRCRLEEVNQAIAHLSKLDTSPGLQISQSTNRPITPDVIVEFSDEDEDFIVSLADNHLPALRLSNYYTDMSRDREASEKTRKFLQSNIRSAQWIIDAIEQRKNTLLKVTTAIVKHQRDFFEKGSLYLRPLPMARVAEDVGVHVATVSRAVAGKYMQSPSGILPLRKFFSGGMEDANGQEHSWEAIRVQLQKIIDSEDKSKPLSDDQIRKQLAEAGFAHIARRTVAKYRGLMNVPAARFRKRY
ncbi:RNA polymerase factor sigma-54 [Planctomycetota bacterium]